MKQTLGFLILGACFLVSFTQDKQNVKCQDDKQSKDHPAKCTKSCEKCNASIKKAITFVEKNLDDMAGLSKPVTSAIFGMACLMASDAKLIDGKHRIEEIRTYLEKYVKRVNEHMKNGNVPEYNKAKPVDSNETHCINWSLAFTGLFFAELKLRGFQDVDKTLSLIISILEDTQVDHGWGHHKFRTKSKDIKIYKYIYPNIVLASSALVSSTLALLKNRLKMKVNALDKIYDHFKICQFSDGSFQYEPKNEIKDFSGIVRTAYVLFALDCLGVSHNDSIFEKSSDCIRKNIENLSEGHGSSSLGLMISALTCQMLGKDEWYTYRDTFIDKIIKNQREDGSFKCICIGKNDRVTCDEKLSKFLKVPEQVTKTYVTTQYTFVLLFKNNLEILKKDKSK